jgi:lipopolysaccharide biosynthesis glycosyltransferase
MQARITITTYLFYIPIYGRKTNKSYSKPYTITQLPPPTLNFINISTLDLDAIWDLVNIRHHYSKECMSRLFADLFFPQYDRIIYSDVDVVFLGDVSQAWTMQTEKSCHVAGIKHLLGSHVMTQEQTAITNSGFLIMNLKQIREDQMGKQWREVMKTNQQGWYDQDIINFCCQSSIGLLPLRFNVCQIDYNFKGSFRTDIYSSKEIEESMKYPVMIHYITGDKPWNTFFSQKQKLWLKELKDTGLVWKFIFRFPNYFLKWLLNKPRFLKKIRRKYFSR